MRKHLHVSLNCLLHEIKRLHILCTKHRVVSTSACGRVTTGRRTKRTEDVCIPKQVTKTNTQAHDDDKHAGSLPATIDSYLLHDLIRKPRDVRCLGQDDGHFDLSEVVAALVEFPLAKVAKRPGSDEPDRRFSKHVVREGPGDVRV